MSHNVIVGGFASNKAQVERAADALAHHYDEEFDGISFREAMNDSGDLYRLTRKARVFTHSAGMVAIRHTHPESITAFTPPVPVPPRLLVERALHSAGEFAASSFWLLDKEGLQCANDVAKELRFHMYGNLRHLNQIAIFDALRAGADAAGDGIDTNLVFMAQDRLFRPSAEEIGRAVKEGVNVRILPGHHEEFIARPKQTIELYGSGAVVIPEEAAVPFPLQGVVNE